MLRLRPGRGIGPDRPESLDRSWENRGCPQRTIGGRSMDKKAKTPKKPKQNKAKGADKAK